jgi:hypothetical protein
MCKNCKSSPLGTQRQSELDASIAECQRLAINPEVAGDKARHAMYAPEFSGERRAALARYNTALSLMKALHNDYVFDLAREAAQARLERINAGKRDYLMEYAQAFDANDDAAQAAIWKMAEGNQGLEMALSTMFTKFDGGRTMCQHLQAIRENR